MPSLLKTAFTVLLTSALCLCAPAPQTFAPLSAGTIVSDNYIIILKPNVSSASFEAHTTWAMNLHHRRLTRRSDPSLAGIKHRYLFSSLTGYSGSFDASTIEEIRASSDVELVEEDKIMVAFDLISQRNSPSWGLPRVSGSKNSNTYTYDSSAGEGVTAYVIDTGINLSHNDFGGRAVHGFSAIDGGSSPSDDGVGHGTHVAGTIGGTTFGVAKKCDLIAVKVLDDSGSGSTSDVIAGVEWTASHATRSGKKAVANMSLGGGFSAALNRAVEAAIAEGITFVVAAGNENVDAGGSSPAMVKTAITVGATDRSDQRAEYSNFGEAVDVFAPGSEITSAWIGGDDETQTIDGTSMASPHVAGLAAYLIALEGLEGPEQVMKRILDLAVEGAVDGVGQGTTDALIFNGASTGGNGTLLVKYKKFKA